MTTIGRQLSKRINWTSERFLGTSSAVAISTFTNLSTNFTVQRQWKFRSPLYIKKIVCNMVDSQTYTVKLYINGSVAKTITFTDSDHIEYPIKGLKLTEGDLYHFTTVNTGTVNDSIIYIEGEYEIWDKLYYEGTSFYWANNSSTNSVGYLGVDNSCNSIASEDVNHTRITGLLIATSVAVNGEATIYHHGATYFTIAYSTTSAFKETYIDLGSKAFWYDPNYYHELPQTQHFTIGLTDTANQQGYASAKFVGYRRELQGRYLFPYIYSHRNVTTTTLQNSSLNWTIASPQVYNIQRFLKPVKYFSSKNGGNGTVGGTLYKNNNLSYDNNSSQGTDLLTAGETYKEYKIDVVNADLKTDTYLRSGNTLSMRIRDSATATTGGYRLICETKL